MARNVRYQIFVSSTYNDLIPARRQVTEHILSMNHIPAGMEMFSASGRQQWATIKKAIDNSDYYVLIVGERYGSLSPEDGISYTEKEFNYALSRNIPTLCFLPGSNYSTPRDHRETDPELIAKLDAFKNRLKEQLCDFWETGDELVSKVSAALYKIFTEEPGTGWIRGDAADPDALSKVIRVMEENKQLQGRLHELEEQALRELPILSLSVNGYSIDEGPLTYVLPAPSDPVSFSPDIESKDIPEHLRALVGDDAIQTYNASKPSETQVNEHNEKLRLYQAARAGKLAFIITNHGPVKANNVELHLSFSDGIRVIKESEVYELVKPELVIPLNPLLVAQFRHDAQLKANATSSSGSHYHFPAPPSAMPDTPPVLPAPSTDLHIRQNGTVVGDFAAVRQDTDMTIFSDIYLVPSKRGCFTLSVTILCDEFRQWQANTVDIIIE